MQSAQNRGLRRSRRLFIFHRTPRVPQQKSQFFNQSIELALSPIAGLSYWNGCNDYDCFMLDDDSGNGVEQGRNVARPTAKSRSVERSLVR